MGEGVAGRRCETLASAGRRNPKGESAPDFLVTLLVGHRSQPAFQIGPIKPRSRMPLPEAAATMQPYV